jgi:hypothetical protein
MEHGPHSAERDADPAPGALADLRPDGPQQPFDLAPSKIGGRRLCEDPGQGSPVPTVHFDMISEMDIGDRGINNEPTTLSTFSPRHRPLRRGVAAARVACSQTNQGYVTTQPSSALAQSIRNK